MQNQLFPIIKSAEQSAPSSSRSAMQHDKQASVVATPFADVIHQLADTQTSTMTKNSTLALTQKPTKGEYDAKIIDAIAVRDHDKAADGDLPIGRDVSDHDIVPLPLLTIGREADQPYLETQSATLNLDSRASQPTVDSHAIAPQYLPASKGLDAGAIAPQFPENEMQSTPSTEAQGQVKTPQDIHAVRSPVELAILSQQRAKQGEAPRVQEAINPQASKIATLRTKTVASQFTPAETASPDFVPPTGTETTSRTSDSNIRDPRTILMIPTPGQHTAPTTLSPPYTNTAKLDPMIGMDGTKDFSELRLDTILEPRPTTHITPPTTTNRSDFSAPVTRQIVDAIHARITAEKVIEVSLNPAELGRLKLSLTPAENGLVINIMAERAETIEMIRRNLSDLEQAFSELGHENITFSFDQNGGFTDQSQPDHTESAANNIELPIQIVATPIPNDPSHRDLKITSGIDIRV